MAGFLGVALAAAPLADQPENLALEHNKNGRALLYLGQLEAARAEFTLALEAALSSGNRIGQAEAINNFGMTKSAIGDLEGAAKDFEDALELLENLADEVPHVSEDRVLFLGNLAGIYRREGNFGEALRLLDRARKIAERRGLSAERVSIPGEQAFIEQIEKRHAAALGLYLDAFFLADELGTPVDLVLFDRLATTLSDLDRPQEAWQLYWHALELAQKANDRIAELGIRLSLCELTSRFPGLEPAAEEDLPACEAARRSAAYTRDPNLLSGLYFGLAKYYEKSDRLDEAIGAGRKAVQQIDTLRFTIPGRNNRSRFLEDRVEFYRYLAELLMKAHSRQPRAGHEIAALELGERIRARSVLDLWSQAGVDLLASADPGLREELATKLAELKTLESLSGPPGATDDRISEILNQLDVLDHQLRQSSANYGRVVPLPSLSVSEVQTGLDDQTAILVLLLGTTRSHLFVLERRRLRTFEIAPAGDLKAAAKDFGELLRDRDATVHPEAIWAAGRRLADLLWGENEERLAGLPQRMVFIGDDALQQLPLAALPRLDSKPQDPHYLIESFEIVHLPALSLLDRFREIPRTAAPSTRRAIFIGDPYYLLENPSRFKMQKVPKEELDRAFPRRANELALGRLPHVDAEARNVQERFGPGGIEMAVGAKASKKLALAPEIGSYGIIHIASHGQFHRQHNELSALLLSQVDEEGNPVDGNLRLQDLYQLPTLRAELVVASACETGIGGEFRQEGVAGLAQGFFQAGARRALVSLWQVESESTSILMDRFYGHLLTGKPPGAALREASLELVARSRAEGKPWAQPFYWAAFVLIGDWSSFQLPDSAEQLAETRVDTRNPATGFIPSPTIEPSAREEN